jgi:hypothetical protein
LFLEFGLFPEPEPGEDGEVQHHDRANGIVMEEREPEGQTDHGVGDEAPGDFHQPIPGGFCSSTPFC